MEELQKLQLAAELEMISYLEAQQREAEEIALEAQWYEYENTPMGRGQKAKAGEQLNRGSYEKKTREEAQEALEQAKRDLGALITTEGPYLKTTVNKKEDKKRYYAVKAAFLKRKRALEEKIKEAEALVVYNENKEKYYKSAKLAPGAIPGRTFGQNLEHLDNYIQSMRDEINARHGVMVPFEAQTATVPFEAPPEAPRRIRLRRRIDLPRGGGRSEVVQLNRKERGGGYTNFDVAREMLKVEMGKLIRDNRKIRRLKKYLQKQTAYKPAPR